jgi:hypothetical protein
MSVPVVKKKRREAGESRIAARSSEHGDLFATALGRARAMPDHKTYIKQLVMAP